MCAPYWPNEKGQTLNFNDYIVELLDVKEFEDYTQRELKLTKETVSIVHHIVLLLYCITCQQTVSDSHTVIQYHYTGWPEHGSPSSGAGMIDLIGQVIKRQQHSHNQPVVVHCRYVYTHTHVHTHAHVHTHTHTHTTHMYTQTSTCSIII